MKKTPAHSRTIGLFDGLTDEEKRERAKVEDLASFREKKIASQPMGVESARAKVDAFARTPPKAMAADVKLVRAGENHCVLAAVGPTTNGSTSYYASVFLSTKQLRKLKKLIDDYET